MELFMGHGFNLNSSTGLWRTAFLAGNLSDEKLTKWFLDHGADPNEEGTTT